MPLYITVRVQHTTLQREGVTEVTVITYSNLTSSCHREDVLLSLFEFLHPHLYLIPHHLPTLHYLLLTPHIVHITTCDVLHTTRVISCQGGVGGVRKITGCVSGVRNITGVIYSEQVVVNRSRAKLDRE